MFPAESIAHAGLVEFFGCLSAPCHIEDLLAERGISQVEPLLNEISHEVGQFTADGTYDGDPTYDAVMRHSAEARIVVPHARTR